MHTGTHHAYVN